MSATKSRVSNKVHLPDILDIILANLLHATANKLETLLRCHAYEMKHLMSEYWHNDCHEVRLRI